MKISTAQRAIMKQFADNVVVIATPAQATNLVRRGMIQPADITPVPTDGDAYSATVKGKTWLARNL